MDQTVGLIFLLIEVLEKGSLILLCIIVTGTWVSKSNFMAGRRYVVIGKWTDISQPSIADHGSHWERGAVHCGQVDILSQGWIYGQNIYTYRQFRVFQVKLLREEHTVCVQTQDLPAMRRLIEGLTNIMGVSGFTVLNRGSSHSMTVTLSTEVSLQQRGSHGWKFTSGLTCLCCHLASTTSSFHSYSGLLSIGKFIYFTRHTFRLYFCITGNEIRLEFGRTDHRNRSERRNAKICICSDSVFC